jgi:hypothetical protein
MKRYEKKTALPGIAFVKDSYFKKPALRFGHGSQTCTMVAARLRHVLRALLENDPADVIASMQALHEMEYGTGLTVEQPKTAKGAGKQSVKPRRKVKP